MYKKDPTSVSRILDIAQEAKVKITFKNYTRYMYDINEYSRLLYIF